MKDATLIGSPVAWLRFLYWWNNKENLTFGQAIEQWEKQENETKGGNND